MKLHVVTYNIHKGVTSVGGIPRIYALKQALSTLDPDILFLQEVQGRNDKKAAQFAACWPDEGQHEFLADEQHYVAYGKNAVYPAGHHGNALISKYQIIQSSNQDISAYRFESRGILHCVLHLSETVQVHCYVVHLGLLAKGRKRQAAALVEAVRSTAPGNAPVIIAGDFNDWEDSLSSYIKSRLAVVEVFDHLKQPKKKWFAAAVDVLLGRKQRIHPARTFPVIFPWLRLDRMYLRGFEVESAEVLHDEHWKKLSDHAPISAVIRLSDQVQSQ